MFSTLRRTFAMLVLLPVGCHRAAKPAVDPTANTDSAQRVSAAAHLRSAHAALLALATVSMETDVPVPVQAATVQLKDALVQSTDILMLDTSASESVPRLQTRLAALLEAPTGPALPDGPGPDENKPVAGQFGGNLKATVTQPVPGTLLIDESFDIECGEDNVLLAYSNASGLWRRILRWQSPAYDKVSGAFGDIFVALMLTPTHDGKPVLLVVHGTPWCTSTVSSFAMDTFALDPRHETDRPFWHGEHGYRRADDVPPYAFALKTTGDGFEVRASVSDWTDSIARVGVMRYRLTPGSVERILPVAMNARETVEEWLGMPRSEAALFTDAGAGTATWKMFDTFTYDGKPETSSVPTMVYGPVRPCTGSPDHFQVEIDSTIYASGSKSSAPGPPWFVQLRQTGDGYRLHDTTVQPDPSCTGSPIRFNNTYAQQ